MAAARSASPAARAKSSISEAPGYEALPMTRLQERYDSEVKPALMQEFGYKNALQVPRLDKIVVNVGVGEAVQDAKKNDAAGNELAAITRQHPGGIRAQQAIAAFKIRQNMPIRGKGIFRRQRLYEVLRPPVHNPPPPR